MSRDGLTEIQKKKMMEEYDMLPTSADGRKRQGYIPALARKWGVTLNYLHNTIKEHNRRNKSA